MLAEQSSLEKVVADIESRAEPLVKTISSALTIARALRGSAAVGDFNELRKALESGEHVIKALQQQFANVQESAQFDEIAYLSSQAFISEVLDAARKQSVEIFEQDGQIYCYPYLLRVLPSERVVTIDKLKERRVRPSALAKRLKELQGKPFRFKAEPFLESLYSAYSLAAMRHRSLPHVPVVIPLTEIYEILTLLPAQKGTYSKQEFARDIYLLDQSRITTTKKGFAVSFPASTGTKSRSSTLSVITQRGQEKKYYGIAFIR